MPLRVLLLPWILLMTLLADCISVSADDTDIYLEGAGSGRPYLHILLDVRNDGAVLCTYGADCSPPFMSQRAYNFLGANYSVGESVRALGVLQAVLSALIERPQLDSLNVALLISNHQHNQSFSQPGKTGGGTILSGYRRLGDLRGELQTVLASLPVIYSGETHVLQPRESFFEWYRYITGGQVALGTNTAGNFGLPVAVPDYDQAIINSGRYLSPFNSADACPRLYGLVVTLGEAADDDDLDGEIAASLPLQPGAGFSGMLNYLQHPDSDLLPAVQNPVHLRKNWVIATRDNAALAEGYARAGGDGSVLYLDEPAALETALFESLRKIAGGSAQFVAASVPVNLNAQGQTTGAVYLGLFQPAGAAWWTGNVKKFRLTGGAGQTGQPVVGRVVDVMGESAFELAGVDKGRIRFNALSYWTDPATLPPGDGLTLPIGADGREVERGGAGQKIDRFVAGYVGDSNTDMSPAVEPARQLFVEPESGEAFLPFNADSATVTELGDLLDPQSQLSSAQRLDVIRWGRGQDTENGQGTARNWLVGGVLHSRPLALNYGAVSGYSEENPLVKLFYGSVDGLFHMLLDTDTAGRQSGREQFAFYPRELLSSINLLRGNKLPSGQQSYGVDGAAVVLRMDRNRDGRLIQEDGDQAFVYVGLRRAGTSYFALDVSDPAALPRLAWTIRPELAGDFQELGLTFSTPLVARVQYEQSPRDVLIFGGGYNGGWNSARTSRTGKDLNAADDTRGNAIYIVDAGSGELIWKAVLGVTGSATNSRYEHVGLVDSIPSSVAGLTTGQGILHRLYVGDTGGALWRVDLPPGDDENQRRDHWLISKLADLGADAGEPGGSAERDLRFFHAPELVQSFDVEGKFDGVLIQSGDRAHPGEKVVENHLFYIKDREVISGSDRVKAENEAINPGGRYRFEDLADQTDCVTGAEVLAATERGFNCGERPTANGWKLMYKRSGEKGLSRPLVDAGRVFATTYTPAASTGCAPLEGQGHLYAIRLADATALVGGVRVYDLGSGIPANAQHLGQSILLPGGGAELYDLDGDGERDMSQLLPSQAHSRYRVYWRDPAMDPL